MKKTERFVACALFFHCRAGHVSLPVCAKPVRRHWRTNLNESKLSPKPNVFYLSQGWYHCVSCAPAIDAKADGQDQPMTGQSYDTLSVREVDAKNACLYHQEGRGDRFRADANRFGRW